MTTSGQADSGSYNDPTNIFRKMESVEEKMAKYQATGTEDKTFDIFRAFISCLPSEGFMNLMDDIIGCHSDEQLRQLASHLVSAVLLPMKSRAQPSAVVPSVRFGAEAEDEKTASELAELSTRNDQEQLKKACLGRDKNQCVLSGYYDADWAAANLTPEQHGTLKTIRTECAHIIPFSLGNFTEGEIPGHAICWNALYRCFPSLRSRVGLKAETINEPNNAITLAEIFRPAFDRLDLVFESTSRENEYRIRGNQPASFVLDFIPPNGTITLTSHDPRYALPKAALFQVHATIAKILNTNRVGEYVEKVLKDRESIRCLAADGSTDI